MGIDIQVGALNAAPRGAARTLLRLAREPMLDVTAAEGAVEQLVCEIHRLKDQVAAVMVDKDQSVRRASEQALDCEEHGKIIRQLEEQVSHFDKAADRNNRGRLTLLNGHQQIHDFATALQAKVEAGEQVPDTKAVADAIAKAVDKTNAAHKRVWSK